MSVAGYGLIRRHRPQKRLARQPQRIPHRLEHRPLVMCSQDAIPMDEGRRFHDGTPFAALGKDCVDELGFMQVLACRKGKSSTSRDGIVFRYHGRCSAAYFHHGRQEHPSIRSVL